MNRHSFSLSSIGMSKGRAQVKLDGEDISDAVNGIGLDFTARETPRVMLELAGVSADVAVDDAEIQLPQKVVELLQRLGWKSPGQAQVLGDQMATANAVANQALNRYRELQHAADQVTEAEDDLEDHIIRLRTVAAKEWLLPIPNSDDAPGDTAAGGVGPVIT